MLDLTRQLPVIAAAAALAVGGVCNPAYASGFTFDFNSLSTSAPLQGGGSVQTYMNGVLAANGGGSETFVNLAGTGLSAGTNIVSNSYTGDSHVMYTAGTELTLGDTDHGVFHGAPNDNFLFTYTGTGIAMQFTGLTPVTGVSFDFEIFPDASCGNANTCGTSNDPDFSFLLNGSLVNNPTVNGVVVGNSHIYAGNPPAGSHSPAETGANFETNPQMGPSTFSYSFGAPMSSFTLEFDDWPATIAIDNLTFTTSTPEPGTMLLLGTGVAALIARKRRQAK